MIRLTIPSIAEDDLQSTREALFPGFLAQGTRVPVRGQTFALDARTSDPVLGTIYSWLAAANVVELCGARSVFMDIQFDVFNMGMERLAG